MGISKRAFYEFGGVPKYGAGVGKSLRKAWKGFKKGFKASQPFLKDFLKLTEEVTRPLLNSAIDRTVINKDANKIVRGAKDLGMKSALQANLDAPTKKELGDQAKDSFRDYLTDQGERILGISEPKSGAGYKKKSKSLIGDDYSSKAWNARKGAGIRVDKLPAKFRGMFL